MLIRQLCLLLSPLAWSTLLLLLFLPLLWPEYSAVTWMKIGQDLHHPLALHRQLHLALL